MNLSNFHLLKEDNENYHVGHPNGKSIVVSKKGLNEKAHGVIQKLAKGGEVKDKNPISQSFSGAVGTGSIKPQPQSANPLPMNYDSGGVVPTEDKTGDLFASIGNGANRFLDFLNTPITQEAAQAEPAPQPVAAVSPQQPPTVAAPVTAPPQPVAPVDPMAQEALDGNAGLAKYRDTVQKGADAEGLQGQQSAAAYGDALAGIQHAKDQFEFRQGMHQAADDRLFKAYADKSIDPDRYWHDKKSGSKVLASIGIALSGMGSATTGQSNYALDNIDRAIKNDIDAQKNDQTKAMNLYKMNREAMHDDQAAYLATQNQLLTTAKLKVEQAAATAQSPLAQERRGEILLGIDQKMAANRFRIGMLQSGNTQSGSIKTDPTLLVPHLVPKEHQKDVTEEIKQAQTARQSKETLLKLFDQAAKEQTMLRTGFGLRDSAARHSLGTEVIPVLRDAAGKVSDTEMHSVEKVFPSAGDTEQRLRTKRQAFENLLEKKAIAPTAKQYGIDLDRFQSTSLNPVASLSPQQKQFYDWAKANPGNPKAELVLEKLKLGAH